MGDQLLDINGSCMVGITNKEAMDILSQHSYNNNNISLVVARKQMEEEEEEVYTDSEYEDYVAEDLATELAHAESLDTLGTDADSNIFDESDGPVVVSSPVGVSSPKDRKASSGSLSENNNSNRLNVEGVVRRTKLSARARRGYRGKMRFR